MKEAVLQKIEELQNKRYTQVGDIYSVLVELKTFVRHYENNSSNTNEK